MAEDLTERVDVDYDELPAVVSSDAGRAAGATLLRSSRPGKTKNHDDGGENPPQGRLVAHA